MNTSVQVHECWGRYAKAGWRNSWKAVTEAERLVFLLLFVSFFVTLKVLRNFKLEIEVDPKHHPKIIGRRGATITKIRQQFDVQIQFPDKAGDKSDIIAITGLEANAIAARDDILKMVYELVSIFFNLMYILFLQTMYCYEQCIVILRCFPLGILLTLEIRSLKL